MIDKHQRATLKSQLDNMKSEFIRVCDKGHFKSDLAKWLDELLAVHATYTGLLFEQVQADKSSPIQMLLWCPECGERHIDEGEFATKEHHTHACQHCGHCWRPAVVSTCGVRFLPGFKNAVTDNSDPTWNTLCAGCGKPYGEHWYCSPGRSTCSPDGAGTFKALTL